MADHLDDGEFWLPPAFLADDVNGFGSFRTPSQLASPVESVNGSTEAESDEEDYMAELTQRMARSAILDDSANTASGCGPRNPRKAAVMAGSPQSTLCDVGVRGYGCRQSSSHGSPNGPSPLDSQSPETWDLLYAAAGEVARMKMEKIDETNGCYPSRGFSGLLKKPGLVEPPNSFNGFGCCFQTCPIEKQLMKQLQQQQQQRQMVQSIAKNSSSFACSNNPNPLGLPSSAWPALQHQKYHQQRQPPQQAMGSGLRPLLVDSSATRKGCAGTGVYLPRRACHSSETRKKPGCSTVLLPARVVQALNLDFEQMGVDSCSDVGVSAGGDIALRLRGGNGSKVVDKQRNPAAAVPNHHEIRLPSEWTY